MVSKFFILALLASTFAQAQTSKMSEVYKVKKVIQHGMYNCEPKIQSAQTNYRYVSAGIHLDPIEANSGSDATLAAFIVLSHLKTPRAIEVMREYQTGHANVDIYCDPAKL